MPAFKPHFKIYTEKTAGRPNQLNLNEIRDGAPPRHLRVGIIKDRRAAYVFYLNALYAKGASNFFNDLVWLYKHSVKVGELSLNDSLNATWAVQGFREFLLSVMTALGHVTGRAVDLDEPFNAQ